MTDLRARAVRALDSWVATWRGPHVDAAYDEYLIDAIVAEFGYKPIATAPRDGTFVVIKLPSGHKMVAQWCADGYWRKDVHDHNLWEPTEWAEVP
jgi:hypothetical protein